MATLKCYRRLCLAIISVSFSLFVITCNNVIAQVTSQVINISPTSSDQDGSDPNSASGGRVNKIATHPTTDSTFFAASEWGGLYKTTDKYL